MTENRPCSIFTPTDKSMPEFQLGMYDSIRLVKSEDWDALSDDASVYLQRPYLTALEDAMSGSMEFRYVVYYCSEFRAVGIAYFQAVDLVDNGSKYRDGVKKLGPVIGNRIVKEMKLRSLVNGNVFHCGDHGFHFSDDLTTEQALVTVESTMHRLKKGNRFDRKLSIVLFKEFWPHQFSASDRLLDKKYHRFPMDVNMVMTIEDHWSDTDDYLKDLVSKSRTRFNSILKKSDAIDIREMDVDEIRASLSKMDELFEGVLAHSPFIFGRLQMAVYVEWKKSLGEDLMFHGFYLDDELIGFNSAFLLGDTLDVHYVGMDYERNRGLMIYQRMLIDLLEFAISRGLKKINFGRTAEQAKSALGAVPVNMMLYTKHRNGIANRLIGPLMNSVEVSEFELRSPFKKTS